MREREFVPLPTEVAGWVGMGAVAPEVIPGAAAHWLVEGFDGQALRELAGLGVGEAGAIHDLLPAALADCGLSIPDSVVASVHVVFVGVAQRYQAGELDEGWVLRYVSRLVRDHWHADDLVRELPMARLFGGDDAWSRGWGPAKPELRALVRQACADELALTFNAES
ncbi:hypothetical protein V5P93_002023 [Actinokineospora auranticolor]|uniref:Uncharacterized protein n=1 Tax=Actinokineospora auranticolor TaxID=155976 RepID=A0A2S6GCK6_9PSEU|nr:hypothetical protein [Actinokineospora auranticolor]PPK62587.1 hypothetical protein CLV40_13449 [Actinokineospora auranticolor]